MHELIILGHKQGTYLLGKSTFESHFLFKVMITENADHINVIKCAVSALVKF